MVMRDNEFSPERVVEVNDLLSIEWYAGDTIVAYVPLEMSSRVIETWASAALEVLQAWPLGQPYLALYDLSGRGVVCHYSRLAMGNMFSLGLTENVESQVEKLIAQREGFKARVAMCTSLRHSGYVGGVLAKFDVLKSPYRHLVKYDVFYERQAAFQWLAEVQ